MDDRRRLELIDRTMAERHAVPNRLIICVLTLLEMGPTPGQRVYAEKLASLWGLSADYASQTVRDLAREDLISVESFMGAAAGWRFLRLGPPLNGPRQVKRRCRRRPQPIVTDCDTDHPNHPTPPHPGHEPDRPIPEPDPPIPPLCLPHHPPQWHGGTGTGR